MDLLQPSPILLPVLSLVIWTFFMMGWMVLTRLPAMQTAGLDPQDATRTADLGSKLPAEVQWKADNYNHLLEQPTLFYATALTLVLMGQGDGLNLFLAWAYVLTRIAHSIVQVTVNRVLLRFSLFALSSVLLLLMAFGGVYSMLS